MREKFVTLAFVLLLCGIVLIFPANALQNGKIAYASSRSGNYDIWVMKADGSEQTQLTTNTAGDRMPAWSPDGSKIAFASNRSGNYDIWVMKADGSGQTQLTTNTAGDRMPAWSPDGSKIAFASNRDGNDEIYVMNSDGTGQTRININASIDHYPTWSPNGIKIAFISDRGHYSPPSGIPFEGYDVWVMNADGTGEKRITYDYQNLAVGDHKISYFGQEIAYTLYGQIRLVKDDGSGQYQPNGNPHGTDPAFSSDGSSITYTKVNGNGNYEIWVMDASGTGQTRLTNNPADEREPAWGPTPQIVQDLRLKVPGTINLGSKGYFLAFVTLPEAYKSATIDMNTVSCSGAPAQRMMKLKIFPRIVGFVFKTSDLQGVEVGKKVTLNIKGELKNKGTTYTFTGADSVKVISKPTWQPDDIKDISKESDDQLFKKFNT
jgi:Tol biopolymer transport system component